MFEQWARKLEQFRIRKHFEQAERLLLSQDTTALTPEAQAARQLHIIHLRDYRDNGIFPRNYQHDYQNPCFIDRDGRVCAVGHLLMTSGQSALALSIADAQNHAYVNDMTSPDLLKWAQDTGLTRDELAFIQPGYSPEAIFSFTSFYSAPFILAAIVFGGFSLRRNITHIKNKKRTILGSVVGMISVWLAFFPASNFADLLPRLINGYTLTPEMVYPPASADLIIHTLANVFLLLLLSVTSFVTALWALFPTFRFGKRRSVTETMEVAANSDSSASDLKIIW